MIQLERMAKVKVLVAGDFMLDKYCYGDVHRLSPEAPVPVVKVQGERYVPGGAANVVNNLCSLGCNTRPFGVIGDDDAARELLGVLKKAGADTRYLFCDKTYKTIVKMRVVSDGGHQIVRLDYHDDFDFPYIDRLAETLKEALSSCNMVVLSDYGKGFFNPTVSEVFKTVCREAGVPLIVDPKGRDWEKYRGVSWITPNFSEFAAIVGEGVQNNDESISSLISNVSRDFEIENVLVTRSEQGMTFFDGTATTHVRTKAKTVYDVSGAGDTVVATLAAMIGLGCEKSAAVELANVAAGIVVGKSGTSTVTQAELSDELRFSRLDRISAKIMDWDTLFAQVKRWKSEHITIAVANGCFDIFHKGHAALIQAASHCADKLIIAINADKTVQKLKGAGRPVNAELDRAYVLAAIESVDAVVIFEQDTPEELLSHIMPDVLVKGGEYTLEQVPGRQYAERVELVDYLEGYSTTAIVNKSREG